MKRLSCRSCNSPLDESGYCTHSEWCTYSDRLQAGSPPGARTIREDTSPVVAVWHSLLGGKFRLRLISEDVPGRRTAIVLDDLGNEIGSAHDLTYGGRGFSVWTKPFAGFVPLSQIDLEYV